VRPYAPPSFDTGLPGVEQEKLELLLDIPLKVTVVLGRTRRPIREVLKLGPGALVELDAMADEPVEILVNGVPVARGEVVVVGENFGVKITSIISPRERVEQLQR
jgi:flagellar motor switch protein FliN/FliY